MKFCLGRESCIHKRKRSSLSIYLSIYGSEQHGAFHVGNLQGDWLFISKAPPWGFIVCFLFLFCFWGLYVCIYVKGINSSNHNFNPTLLYFTLLYYPSSSVCLSLSLSVDVDVLYYTILYQGTSTLHPSTRTNHHFKLFKFSSPT